MDEYLHPTSLVGPLARYVELRIAHAPGMPGTFSPPPWVNDPAMHHGTCETHVPWCMPGSLISSFLWSRWRGKLSRHSQRMRNPQFYASWKRPMDIITHLCYNETRLYQTFVCLHNQFLLRGRPSSSAEINDFMRTPWIIMTSSNGNIFRVTGPLWRGGGGGGGRYRSPVNSPHKSQWLGSLMFS